MHKLDVSLKTWKLNEDLFRFFQNHDVYILTKS